MHYLHNELTYIMPNGWQQGGLPPINKLPQHISCRASHTKRITILKNHQANQRHTDIQLLVILEKSGR